MKILSTVWSLYFYNNNNLDVFRNGAAVVINDICEYIGCKEESYVFVGSRHIKGTVFNHINVIDNMEYLPQERNDIKEWQDSLQKRLQRHLHEMRTESE